MGANCGVRTALFREFGGFDESYTRGGDETELFWRIQLAGHPVDFVSDAILYYRERFSTRDLWRQFYFYGKQDPHLYRDFRKSGMPGRGVGAGLRSWGHLVAFAPRYAAHRRRTPTMGALDCTTRWSRRRQREVRRVLPLTAAPAPLPSPR